METVQRRVPEGERGPSRCRAQAPPSCEAGGHLPLHSPSSEAAVTPAPTAPVLMGYKASWGDHHQAESTSTLPWLYPAFIVGPRRSLIRGSSRNLNPKPNAPSPNPMPPPHTFKSKVLTFCHYARRGTPVSFEEEGHREKKHLDGIAQLDL